MSYIPLKGFFMLPFIMCFYTSLLCLFSLISGISFLLLIRSFPSTSKFYFNLRDLFFIYFSDIVYQHSTYNKKTIIFGFFFKQDVFHRNLFRSRYVCTQYVYIVSVSIYTKIICSFCAIYKHINFPYFFFHIRNNSFLKRRQSPFVSHSHLFTRLEEQTLYFRLVVFL